jgi:hypothetical protein
MMMREQRQTKESTAPGDTFDGGNAATPPGEVVLCGDLTRNSRRIIMSSMAMVTLHRKKVKRLSITPPERHASLGRPPKKSQWRRWRFAVIVDDDTTSPLRCTYRHF